MQKDEQAWQIEHAAWTAEKRKVEASAKEDLAQRKARLRDLGPEPERPLYPVLTMPDPTAEGLAKAWANAPASLGVFAQEGQCSSPDTECLTKTSYARLPACPSFGTARR